MNNDLVASIIVIRIRTQPVWDKDIAKVNKTVQDLATRVAELAELTATLRTDYATLLERLPGAIGHGFTHSLFSYYPRTSASIADMLSTRTDRIYQENYDRDLVTRGEDTYKLLGLVERDVDGKRQMMWSMHFRIFWKWLNDSRVIRYPLRDFMILLSAPEEITKAYRGASVAERDSDKDAYHKLLRHANYVLSCIEHPVKPDRRVSPAELQSLLLVESVKIDIEGQDPKILAKDELTSMKATELHGPVLAGYRMPEYVANCPLATGREMSFEYRGKMFLRAEKVKVDEAVGGTKPKQVFRGEISFLPSDVIRDQYSFNLVYPEVLNVPDGEGATIVVEQGAGCRFVGDPSRRFIPAVMNPDTVPPDCSSDDGDKTARNSSAMCNESGG